MSAAQMIGAIGAAILGIIVFAYQKQQDRRHQIMAERRRLYEGYAAAMAPLMFRVIDPKSPEHFNRLKAINEMAARLQIIASPQIYIKHRELVAHLSEKVEGKYSLDEVDFFDAEALHLYEETVSAMRKDALPRDMW